MPVAVGGIETMNITSDLGLPAGMTFTVMAGLFAFANHFGYVVRRDQMTAVIDQVKAESRLQIEALRRDFAEKYVTHDDLQDLKQTITERVGRVEQQIDQLGARILEAIAKKP